MSVCHCLNFDADFESCLMSSLGLFSSSSPESADHPPMRLNIQQAVSSQNDHQLLSLIHQHPSLIPRSESPPSIPSIFVNLDPSLRVYAQLSFVYSSCFSSSTPCSSFFPFVLLRHLVLLYHVFSPFIYLVVSIISRLYSCSSCIAGKHFQTAMFLQGAFLGKTSLPCIVVNALPVP